MYCQNCGASNHDDATKCNACGASITQVGGLRSVGAPQINNYLIPAIFSTVCCCLPFGIVSIVYAAQVNGLLRAGDIDGATKSASNAKMWFWIAFGLGLAALGIYVVLMMIAALADMSQGPR